MRAEGSLIHNSRYEHIERRRLFNATNAEDGLLFVSQNVWCRRMKNHLREREGERERGGWEGGRQTERDWTVKMNYATFFSSRALWLLRPSSHGDRARQTVAYFFFFYPKGEKNDLRQNGDGDCCNKLELTQTPARSVRGPLSVFNSPKFLLLFIPPPTFPPSSPTRPPRPACLFKGQTK